MKGGFILNKSIENTCYHSRFQYQGITYAGSNIVLSNDNISVSILSP
jgi:hypothetical protein